MDDLRMNAYYYSFQPTGVREIDMVLSAVACAGKAYHSTADWDDETPKYYDEFEGETPVEWIQNAADKAAAKFNKSFKADAVKPCECPTVDLTKTIAHCSVCGGSLHRTA